MIQTFLKNYIPLNHGTEYQNKAVYMNDRGQIIIHNDFTDGEDSPLTMIGTPAKDDNNPDKNLRSRQIMGLNMLSGLKKTGDEYSGGKIYDPGNGKTYNCSMKVEGDVLKVRGSLDKRGLLGRTMDWFRVKE